MYNVFRSSVLPICNFFYHQTWQNWSSKLIFENEYASDYEGELSESKLFRGHGDLLFYYISWNNTE